MKEIGYLVKRNSLLFLRERSAVFFSLLSMLIVLALMVIFLGRMNSRALVDLLSEWGGERDLAADERNAAYLIQLWTLAGILVVNAVTVTLTVTGIMVQDETEKRLMAQELRQPEKFCSRTMVSRAATATPATVPKRLRKYCHSSLPPRLLL